MPNRNAHYMECPFCERKHQWYSMPSLAEQFDVDPETIRRRLWKVDHIRIGRTYRIPECQVDYLIDEVVETTSYG